MSVLVTCFLSRVIFLKVPFSTTWLPFRISYFSSTVILSDVALVLVFQRIIFTGIDEPGVTTLFVVNVCINILYNGRTVTLTCTLVETALPESIA